MCVREREIEGREVMSKQEVKLEREREREWLCVSEFEKKSEGEKNR